jgi:hypothetical protein
VAAPYPPDTAALIARISLLATARLGGSVASVLPVAAGLGSRRFFRLRLEGARVDSLIARVEAPEDPKGRAPGIPPEPALEPVRAWMEQADLPVPRSHGSEDGIDLLEDLGSETLKDAALAADAAQREALYRAACSLVPRIQRLPVCPGGPAFERELSPAWIAYKAEEVIRWVLPLSLSRPPRPAEAEALREAFAGIAEICLDAPRRPAHRDFQSTNLLLKRVADAPPQCVMIDLQGAFLAPPEYDLVCLLRDPHVALSEREVAARVEEVRGQLPDAPDATTFDTRFTLLGLARCGKDLARYLYAASVRGDTRMDACRPAAAASIRSASLRAAAWDLRFERAAELLAPLKDVFAPPERSDP